MHQRAVHWRLLAIAGGLSLLILYFYGLDRMGLYGPDEPRYASIGREMARTGDLVTPRLWGDPWFEKPPLLYWITAIGFRAGLSSDLAPRVPVALLSVLFLIAFFWMLRREFGATAAAYSTTILATSAGWIALSEVAVTDIPMAAMFTLALLFALPWLRNGDRRWLNAAAVALGAAFLAKSIPPLVLALPMLWFGRDRLRDLFRPAPWLLFLLVAAPWHILCYLRNGPAFPRTLFLQHQLGRFLSPDLQHVQHWWYYLPLLPLGFIPWAPLLALLVRRRLYHDRRLQFLVATAAWGLLFFSASVNKLATYLMPLLPPLVIVAGVALERTRVAGRVVLALSALTCAVFPLLVTRLPAAMSRNPQAAAPALPVALAVITVLVVAAVCFLRSQAASLALVAALACTGYLWIKIDTLPFADEAATARPIWRQVQPVSDRICVKDIPRDWRYGLNYYSEKPLPDCWQAPSRPGFLYYQPQTHQVLLSPP